MASIVLSAAGAAAGQQIGGPIGATIGARIGRSIGNAIDNKLFSSGKKTSVRSAHLADLGLQTSTYGKMIPLVYGMVRIGGNIIWAQPILETVTTTTSSSGGGGGGGKGGGGKVTQTSSSYSYSVTLAVAICEGPVTDILRIWADAKQLDLSQYTVRLYKGDEDQLPDSLIQSIEGAGKTPAYRGVAYVVFENFPLADYGNRIPNFTFEVKKKALYPDYNNETVEDMIAGMVMIPGAGEFVYDTKVGYKVPGAYVGGGWVQQGNQQRINMHNPAGKANALLSLDQLQDICPNVEWVSVVVAWFGDSMDAGSCVIKPGVEYQIGGTTTPDLWSVAGYDRATARLITFVGDSPQYGGTPDDNSIVRYVDELCSRGFKVLFYPLLFMDATGKPWRGDLTGSASDVSNFFTKTNGYNAFITHYANLVDGKVDAFVIGSELKGLTKVTDTPGNYPAVNQLVSLAGAVKAVLGGGVTVTYAADWSEYHHTDGGWYHLDPLWASNDIDVIGIDAYFPLTDAPQAHYDIDTVKAGWTSGEGYDWYYSDEERTVQVPLDEEYAWKNIAWFWGNTHINPDASPTDWVPESKKIWFTEYGFPSVDGATNQPNIFFDPSSSYSGLPYYSKGRIDFRAQRTGIAATQQQWKDSDMVEQLFLWTWDARPFPYWPDLTSVWSDGGVWKYGHWVQGKLGISSLAAIVEDLALRAGLQAEDVNVSGLGDQVEGFVISEQQPIRNAIESLQHGYFFDTVETDNILKFIPRGSNAVATIDEVDIIPLPGNGTSELCNITRVQEIELPRRVNVVYLNRLSNYQTATQYSQREVTASREVATLDLSIVLADQVAKNIADITLFSDWVGRTSYEFDLPMKYARLEPADVIVLTVGGQAHRMRIISTYVGAPGIVRVKAVAEDISTFDFYNAPGNSDTVILQDNKTIPSTKLELLDIPAFPTDDADKAIIRVAGVGVSEGWAGAVVYRSDDNGDNYARFTTLNAPAVIGTASTVLAAGPSAVFDDAHTVTVLLLNNAELQSVSELAVLNGANAALLGDEVIQFKTATLLAPGEYSLSGLLRGRLGTEWATGAHAAGERFVLFDGALGKETAANNIIGLQRQYKPVTIGNSLSSAEVQNFTYSGVALKPYSPAQLEGARDVSGNLSLSWLRRTRIGGDWRDNVDVSLGEAAEAYEVDIMDGGAVVRTITGLGAASATYSAAEQVADFGGVQSSISVRVFQISATVGRGYAALATL